jgi:hypothetical protein
MAQAKGSRKRGKINELLKSINIKTEFVIRKNKAVPLAATKRCASRAVNPGSQRGREAALRLP